MADVIRSKEQLKVGELEQIRVRVDGFIHQSKQLKMENTEAPDRIMTVSVCDVGENVYTRAGVKKGYLDITAKPTRKADATLHTLHVMDAKAVYDDGA